MNTGFPRYMQGTYVEVEYFFVDVWRPKTQKNRYYVFTFIHSCQSNICRKQNALILKNQLEYSLYLVLML